MFWDVLGQLRTFCYILGCFGGVFGHVRAFRDVEGYFGMYRVV